MSDIYLTQQEAELLIAMEKLRENDTRWNYPQMGGSIRIPLISTNKREKFMFDITRGNINQLKVTYQNRARQAVVLVRLDIAGPAHPNPDGEVIPCPHLHIYREGYGDKWASPIPIEIFTNINDSWQSLLDFQRYCNITVPPIIDRGLFV
jgi:MoaA/NifB/PqqE/SkfB family radical SAM enzyme